eukprot:1924790-Alexandrium_andersonii.AAC.1
MWGSLSGGYPDDTPPALFCSSALPVAVGAKSIGLPCTRAQTRAKRAVNKRRARQLLSRVGRKARPHSQGSARRRGATNSTRHQSEPTRMSPLPFTELHRGAALRGCTDFPLRDSIEEFQCGVPLTRVRYGAP